MRVTREGMSANLNPAPSGSLPRRQSSPLINPDNVGAVMLAGRWVHVKPGTFEIHQRDWATGEASEFWSFSMTNDQGEGMCGPLDTVQAVRTQPAGKGGA